VQRKIAEVKSEMLRGKIHYNATCTARYISECLARRIGGVTNGLH
jgi:hypothetical protein